MNPKKCERRKKAIPIYFTKVNVIKMNTRESKEKKFETKVRQIGRVVLIFI